MSTLEKTYITDTTPIVAGTLRLALARGLIKGRLVIHTAIISVFEKLAKDGVSRGLVGLRELKELRQLAESEGDLFIEYVRDLPEGYRWSPDMDVDAMVRDLAVEIGACLVTSEPLNAAVAEGIGLEVLYLEPPSKQVFVLEQFFSNDTMSIHLKEGVKPYAKKGLPGRWSFVELRDRPMSRDELEGIVQEILEYAKSNSNSFIECERPGSMILQVDRYRIVISRPPFSDGLEITAVRPLVKLSLDDYNLPRKLLMRLEKQAEGILIAGAPGMGKTTFAQALAEYYWRKNKVVKTIESPRDMQLPEDITQYSKSYATSEELHDVLLLSRPDYTFFDEMRDTRDFELYADLRLAGVGMVGVIHATSPIDAIQRFIGRVELGMIPSIVDTVIFIENGEVKKVYELETTVKVPHGLREAELARPVVIVKDFMSGEPEYELYVFGERTFVVPVGKKSAGGKRDERTLASITRLLEKYIPSDEIELQAAEEGRIIVLVSTEYYNYLVGKPRRRLERLARKLGVEIELMPKLQ